MAIKPKIVETLQCNVSTQAPHRIVQLVGYAVRTFIGHNGDAAKDMHSVSGLEAK